MMKELELYGAGHHVIEVYSPPRVTSWAAKMRMAPGLALDLTCKDDDGLPWDFNNPDKVRKAKKLIQDTKPLLLLGSPMCSAFSTMNNINFSRMSPQDVEEVVQYGKRHLEVCLDLYRTHMRNKLYFLHEHPATARSWKLEEVQRIMNRKDVRTVTGDMCRFGMKMEDEQGELKAVRKRTKFMTNAPEIAKGPKQIVSQRP